MIDVKLKFCKDDKCVTKLAKKLKDADYRLTISRPYQGSIPIMWIGEACFTGSKKIVKAVGELLGQKSSQ